MAMLSVIAAITLLLLTKTVGSETNKLMLPLTVLTLARVPVSVEVVMMLVITVAEVVTVSVVALALEEVPEDLVVLDVSESVVDVVTVMVVVRVTVVVVVTVTIEMVDVVTTGVDVGVPSNPNTYVDPEFWPWTSPLQAPTTARLPSGLTHTAQPKLSLEDPSSATILCICVPVVPLNTYTDPEREPRSSSPYTPTTTEFPLELTDTENPNVS
mmetsp:Transcript_42280/g.117797  ORF Transcript_42280/g.117797 Transcript_42280/m.117797 type:complete len:213 (+) Transcript_42280:190-828(+)